MKGLAEYYIKEPLLEEILCGMVENREFSIKEDE
jgi:hypothetical protein